MEKFIYTDQTTINKKKDVILGLIIAILLACSFVLCINDMFGLSYGIKDAFSGTIGEGMVCFNNKVAEALGNSQYVLMDKLQGSSETPGTFVTVTAILITLACYGILKGKKKLALIIVILPAILPAILFDLNITMISVAMMIISVIIALIYMSGDSSAVTKGLIFLVFVTVVCIGTFKIPQVSGFVSGKNPVTSVRESIQSKVSDLYYGENPLGSGNLSQRQREEKKGVAMEVTMENPHSMYLRGFVGEKYTSEGWETLTPSAHYGDIDMMHWLSEGGFNALGQSAQVGDITNGSEEEHGKVEISVKKADKRIGYVPYEISSDIEKGKSWGGSFVTAHKFGKLKNYEYEAGQNPAENWTTSAAKLFTEAKGEETEEYLLLESYYNPVVYKNYAYISPNEREILRKYLGTDSESVTSHMEYKKAIGQVKDYLDSNFIYTKALGDSDEKDPLKGFFVEKKGYDVQFATAATMMFRYYGIPARYVEGYLITPEDAKDMKSGEPYAVSESKAHAWTEIYVDGVGFVPIEVSPEYDGAMKEADMNVGISNDALKSTFDEQGGGSSDTYEVGGDGKSHKKIDVLLLMAMLILILIIIAIVIALAKKIYRSSKEAWNMHKMFVKAEPNKAVSAIFMYLENHRYPISDEVREKGNRAAYSKEVLKEEDRTQMLSYLKGVKKERRKDERKKIFKRNTTASSSSDNDKRGFIKLQRKKRTGDVRRSD